MPTLDIARQFLGKAVTVTIDRPLGSKHPKHGFEYPLNYGFIEGVTAGDGEELDAYCVGFPAPAEKLDGVCVAIVHREDDDDDKLVVVPAGQNPSDAEILAAVEFQEKWFKSSLLRA